MAVKANGRRMSCGDDLPTVFRLGYYNDDCCLTTATMIRLHEKAQVRTGGQCTLFTMYQNYVRTPPDSDDDNDDDNICSSNNNISAITRTTTVRSTGLPFYRRMSSSSQFGSILSTGTQ